MKFNRLPHIILALCICGFSQDLNPSVSIDFDSTHNDSRHMRTKLISKLAKQAKFHSLLESESRCKDNTAGFPYQISTRSVKPRFDKESVSEFIALDIGICGSSTQNRTLLFATKDNKILGFLDGVCADNIMLIQDPTHVGDLLVGTCSKNSQNYQSTYAESYRFFDGHLQSFSAFGMVGNDNCQSPDKVKIRESSKLTLFADGKIESKKSKSPCN